jgi:hypothetical protein
MDKNVAILVKICKDSETTGDVRGRLFELLVIKSFVLYTASIKLEKTLSLPIPQEMPETSNRSAIYVPRSQKFHDFLWKIETYIIGVQVHTSKHKDVTKICA